MLTVSMPSTAMAAAPVTPLIPSAVVCVPVVVAKAKAELTAWALTFMAAPAAMPLTVTAAPVEELETVTLVTSAAFTKFNARAAVPDPVTVTLSMLDNPDGVASPDKTAIRLSAPAPPLRLSRFVSVFEPVVERSALKVSSPVPPVKLAPVSVPVVKVKFVPGFDSTAVTPDPVRPSVTPNAIKCSRADVSVPAVIASATSVFAARYAVESKPAKVVEGARFSVSPNAVKCANTFVIRPAETADRTSGF